MATRYVVERSNPMATLLTVIGVILVLAGLVATFNAFDNRQPGTVALALSLFGSAIGTFWMAALLRAVGESRDHLAEIAHQARDLNRHLKQD